MTGADLLALVMPRLAKLPNGSGVPFEIALNKAVNHIFNHLHRLRSDIVRVRFDGLETDVDPFDLPGDFRGLASSPLYLLDSSGANIGAMTELPLGESVDTDPGIPMFFYLSGARQMGVSPVPDQAYTIDGWYYACPNNMTLSSLLPWDGLFDNAIESAVLMLAAGAPDMNGVIEEVDGIVFSRSVAPKRNRCW